MGKMRLRNREGLENLTEGADSPVVTLAKIRLPGCNCLCASVSSALCAFTGKQASVAPA